MIERQGTWSEVEVSTTLLSPTGLPLVCVRAERGWLLLEDRSHHKFRISPKPPGDPVTLLEMTPEEAEVQCQRLLGAYHLLDQETEARVEVRSHQWLVPPLPTRNLEAVSDHIDWYHGTYVRAIPTGRDATARRKKKEVLDEMIAAHTEMHEPGNLFMDRPHTHREA